MKIACPRCGTAYEVDPGRFGGRWRAVQCSACNYRWSQPPDPSAAVAPGPENAGRISVGASALQQSRAAQGDGDSPGGDFVAKPGGGEPGPEAPPEPGSEEGGGGSPATEMPPELPALSGTADREASGSTAEGRRAGPETSPGPLLAEEAPVMQVLRQQGGQDAPVGPQASDDDPATEDTPASPTGLHRPLWRRLPRGPGLVAAIVAMAAAVVLAALLIALRGPILAALPASAGFYASFGLLPDPLGAGLEIRDVSTARAREGSGDVLTVSGVVANVIDAPADVPFLRVSLYDAGDRQLQAIDLPGPRASLKPAEAVGFDVRISDLQPGTRRVRVGFTAPPGPAQR